MCKFSGKGILIDTKEVKTYSYTFENFLAAQKYTVKLVANTSFMISSGTSKAAKHFFSNPSTIELHTLPGPPDALKIVSTELNSVSITWNEAKIATEAQLIQYVVKYHELKSTGSSKKIIGDEIRHNALQNTFTTVSGLAQGTVYGFRVKVSYSC